MPTFLELCQELRRDCGISGSGPVSVTSTNLMDVKLVNLIKEADYRIQCKWKDWNFLWSQHTANLVIDQVAYSAPSDLANWDIESFMLDYTTASYSDIVYVPYKDWRSDYRNGTQTSGTPYYFTIKPDNSIAVYPPPDSIQTLTADYWKTPTKLSDNGDTSDIPARFHRVIVQLAKAWFMESRHDGGRFQFGMADHADILKDLEDAELPERYERMSNAPLQVVVPE